MSRITPFLYIIIALGLFTSCGKSPEATQQTTDAEKKQQAKGERSYGGVFRISEPGHINDLFPLSLQQGGTAEFIARQVYEGLFTYSNNALDIEKQLVESYELDSTLTEYTFHLKKGVHFHDDACFPDGQGKELKAADIRYCFARLCERENLSETGRQFRQLINGGQAHFLQTQNNPDYKTDSIPGIQVVDDYTLKISLNKPYAYFPMILAQPAGLIYAPEAVAKYGDNVALNAVGTGAFMLSNAEDDIQLTLKRNPNYHKKDHYDNDLPLLDNINVRFIKEKSTALSYFLQEKLEGMQEILPDMLINLLEKSEASPNGEYEAYNVQRIPQLTSYSVIMNNQYGYLRNVNLRKAINFAIDRDRLLDFVLNGKGYETGIHGITPPALGHYDIKQIKGYRFDLDSATQYMRRSGHPNGWNLPTFTLLVNQDSDIDTAIYQEIKKQLKTHVNIDIRLALVNQKTFNERCRAGNYQLAFKTWQADFPSASNFLDAFSSKHLRNRASDKNICRYYNRKFDEWYNKAENAPAINDAKLALIKAENILMADAPIVVLWYDEQYRIFQSYVENFPKVPMPYGQLDEVYFQQARNITR